MPIFLTLRNWVANLSSRSMTRAKAVVDRNAHLCSGGSWDKVTKGTFASATIGWIARLTAEEAPFSITLTLYWLISWFVTVTPVVAFEALSRMCRLIGC